MNNVCKGDEIRTARYLWGIPYVSTISMERCLHNYYYELIKLLCDSSTSLTSLADNFDDEIFDFITERGSHPGIPLFHTYRQHGLSSFDDGFPSSLSVHVQLTDICLSLDGTKHIVYNDDQEDGDVDNNQNEEEDDVNALREKLSKLYKNEDALNEALKKLNIDSTSSGGSQNKNDESSKELEFDFEMNDSPIPLYLQCGLYIYHGNEYDNIDDVISNKAFEPNLVSDFVNINAADWNRLFHWRLITRTPVGYVECDNNNCEQLKKSLDKLLEEYEEDDDGLINVTNCYQASKTFRSQSTDNISLWKVVEATETIL